MKILLTGGAGFIGFHVTKELAGSTHQVLVLDSVNDYYDVELKLARLEQLGLRPFAIEPDQKTRSAIWPNLSFQKLDLADFSRLQNIFQEEKPDIVCHLAAQPGVRTSILYPELYLHNNVVAFFNLLECCRHFGIKRLVYASSSSVYGKSNEIPFAPGQCTDHPESFYAATKKSNEIFAESYSHLYKIPMTGLRFFTVYGPWGRPDMAIFKFTRAIQQNNPIDLYNNGEMSRDFTFVKDIAAGVVRVLDEDFSGVHIPLHRLYNIGGAHPVKIADLVSLLEKVIGKKARIHPMPMQPGDVIDTWADNSAFERDFGAIQPTELRDGISAFWEWYKKYYRITG